MFFQHVYDETLAQGSYFIGCQANEEAIVIDARRDVDIYLDIAKQNNFKITKIAETHIHADFLCGSRELAELTGAEIYLSDEGGKDWQYEFDHIGLNEGDTIKLGNISLEVLYTPGHTPESISFLLTDHAATEAPIMILTGDFVFVGDVGRPDLLEKAAGIMGTKEEGAMQLFRALKRFESLPGYVQVWPGHGAGSACGKALGAVPVSTVGYEKITNWALQFNDAQDEFSNVLLAGQPEPPRYFAMMKQLNKTARPLLTKVPNPPKLNKNQFLSAYEKGMKVIDTRDKAIFAEGFLPGSLNIQNNKTFSTWMGWLLDYQEHFILIAEDGEIEELTRKLMRIGMDNIHGYISDIRMPGLELQQADIADIAEVRKNINKKEVQIVDVRGENEYEAGHIEGAQNLFVGTLENNLEKINKEHPVIVHCQSGVRSTIAYSILKKSGYEKVKNFSGGMDAWLGKKQPVVKNKA